MGFICQFFKCFLVLAALQLRRVKIVENVENSKLISIFKQANCWTGSRGCIPSAAKKVNDSWVCFKGNKVWKKIRCRLDMFYWALRLRVGKPQFQCASL